MRPSPESQVEPAEQRHDHEALHGHGEVLAHHLAELVGLALEAEGHALDLLVVLELGLEELDHLDRRPGGAGDGDRRVPVGGKDLLHGAMGDDVALGGAAVSCHHHAVGEAQRHHRGAVRHGRDRAAGCCPVDTSNGWDRSRAADQGGETGPRVLPGRKERQTHPATPRPSARSCGRTPPRSPRGPRRSRRAGRRARP